MTGHPCGHALFSQVDNGSKGTLVDGNDFFVGDDFENLQSIFVTLLS
jgi:hypothetical protein